MILWKRSGRGIVNGSGQRVGTPGGRPLRSPAARQHPRTTMGSFRDDALAWHGQGIQVSGSRQALARPPGDDGTSGIEERAATT